MDDLRLDLKKRLAAYLSGTVTVDGLLAWEASLSLDPSVPGALRRDLDRIALIGEEVEEGMRGEEELRAAAREILESYASSAR